MLGAAVAADFTDFQKSRGRKYRNAQQAAQAEAHYKRHRRFFDDHNAKYEAGEVSFTVGVNDFADQKNTEVIAQLCKTIPPKELRALPVIQDPSTFPAGAASKDWTSIMQPVVDQRECGGCWAFATVAQLESLYKRNSPSYNFVMAPQYLVDCDRINDGGCNGGGWPANAMSKINILIMIEGFCCYDDVLILRLYFTNWNAIEQQLPLHWSPSRCLQVACPSFRLAQTPNPSKLLQPLWERKASQGHRVSGWPSCSRNLRNIASHEIHGRSFLRCHMSNQLRCQSCSCGRRQVEITSILARLLNIYFQDMEPISYLVITGWFGKFFEQIFPNNFEL